MVFVDGTNKKRGCESGPSFRLRNPSRTAQRNKNNCTLLLRREAVTKRSAWRQLIGTLAVVDLLLAEAPPQG